VLLRLAEQGHPVMENKVSTNEENTYGTCKGCWNIDPAMMQACTMLVLVILIVLLFSPFLLLILYFLVFLLAS
jgi:hypothetical protein